jgi:hypothetical protein
MAPEGSGCRAFTYLRLELQQRQQQQQMSSIPKPAADELQKSSDPKFSFGKVGCCIPSLYRLMQCCFGHLCSYLELDDAF